jgi:chromosome segregation ATPase
VLESGLFFILGFLCAMLLALLVAPAIWRRAVALTRKRIESAVPLSVNEMRGEKDRLRAEFAMTQRRLEKSVDELKAKSAEQLIDINRRRDEMNKLEETALERNVEIEALQAQSKKLRDDLASREDELSETKFKLADVETRFEDQSLNLNSLTSDYRKVVDQFDDQKIEMVTRDTKLASVQDETRDSKRLLTERAKEIEKLGSDLKVANRALKSEKSKISQLDTKLANMQAQLADMEAKLQRRNADIERLRGKATDGESASLDVSNELEKRLDESLLQQSDLRDQLATVESERETLRIELSALKISGASHTDAPQQSDSDVNAEFREKIAALAAKVTAATSEAEGDTSPIKEALKKTPKSKTTKARSKRASKSSSLAERIKSLQDQSESA